MRLCFLRVDGRGLNRSAPGSPSLSRWRPQIRPVPGERLISTPPLVMLNDAPMMRCESSKSPRIAVDSLPCQTH
jgi:hypothetical protein